MNWRLFCAPEGEGGTGEPQGEEGGGSNKPDTGTGEQNTGSEDGGEGTSESSTLLGKGSEGEGSEEGSEESSGAPESYADFTFPDGTEVDEDLLGSYQNAAKAANLTQEQAQALAEFWAKHTTDLGTQLSDAASEQKKGWEEACAEDEVIGGKDYEANLAMARRGFAEFGDQELAQLLDQTGLGSHPALVRAFYHLGKSLSEDSMVSGQDGAGERSAAEVLFSDKK